MGFMSVVEDAPFEKAGIVVKEAWRLLQRDVRPNKEVGLAHAAAVISMAAEYKSGDFKARGLLLLEDGRLAALSLCCRDGGMNWSTIIPGRMMGNVIVGDDPATVLMATQERFPIWSREGKCIN